MWKKFVNDYLSFTKKDRVAVIVLVTLICMVAFLPYLWPVSKPPQLSREQLEKIKLLTSNLQPGPAGNQPGDPPAPTHYSGTQYASNERKEKAAVFYFDPNTLDVAGWKRLGIRDRTAATIQNFLAKGGKFRKPEDIGKIYGLFNNDYQRLLPYVQIKTEAGSSPNSNFVNNSAPANTGHVYPKKTLVPASVDINLADTTAFIALPGIGSKLAARIINFREKLGGFYTVQQVAETFGLADSVFSKIQPLLQCNRPAVQQININSADANTLKQHPYLRWNLANAIVQYRNQHGDFTSVDQLQRIALITPEILVKISPYLRVQ